MRLDPNPRQRVGEWTLAFMAGASAWIVVAVCGWILWDVVGHGFGVLSWSFLTDAPADAGRGGGIAPMIVATLAILGVCLATSIPLALGAALAIVRVSPSRFGVWIGRSLDTLAAVPSVVFGLFGSVFFCDVLGLGFSILSGGLTLGCMILPLLVRTAEIGLRSVPDAHRLGAAALALSQTTSLFAIVLPAAAPALLAGVVLGLGRAVAETAALIFTSGYVDRMPTSLFDSGRALSVHVYDLVMNISGGESHAHASALVLVVVTLAANQATSLLLARFENRRLV